MVWSVEEDRYGMVSLGRLWSGRESVGCLGMGSFGVCVVMEWTRIFLVPSSCGWFRYGMV